MSNLTLSLFISVLSTVGCCVYGLNNYLIDLSSIKNYFPKIDEMISSVCYAEIESCFNQNAVYDVKNRRLTLYTPQTPQKLNLRLYLLNRIDDDLEKAFHFYYNNLTDQLLSSVQLTNNQHTLILIPGWTEEYADCKNWIQSLDNWPNKENYQIIVVDWSECSMKSSKGKIDLAKTHLIGRDLGSHIAGQVGNELNNNKKLKLFKITAFDQPLDLFEEANDSDKIDLHDANQVEVIHTNANRKEFIQNSIGSTDVFVYDSQATVGGNQLNQFMNQSKFSSNSEIDLKMRAAIRNSLSYRNEKDCHLLAYRCESYQNFLDGKCSTCDSEQNCKLIGLWSNQLNTKFDKSKKPLHYYSVQNTNRTPCAYHYQIQVSIGSIFKNRKSKGIIEITVQNETVSIQDEFSRNQTYTKLFVSIGPLTDLKQIKVTWINLATGLWVFSYSNAVHVDKIKLNYLSTLDAKIRADYSSLYCLSNLGTNVIAHKQFIYLRNCSKF